MKVKKDCLWKQRTHKITKIGDSDFMDCQKAVSYLAFTDLSYTKVKELKYDADKPFHIEYKISYTQDKFTEINIRGKKKR